MTCENCGRSLSDKDNFCTSCGARVMVQEPSQYIAASGEERSIQQPSVRPPTNIAPMQPAPPPAPYNTSAMQDALPAQEPPFTPAAPDPDPVQPAWTQQPIDNRQAADTQPAFGQPGSGEQFSQPIQKVGQFFGSAFSKLKEAASGSSAAWNPPTTQSGGAAQEASTQESGFVNKSYPILSETDLREPSNEEVEAALRDNATPEVLLAQVPGKYTTKDYNSYRGYCVVTNKRVLFFPFNLDAEETFNLGPLDALDEERYAQLCYTREVHSIQRESVLFDTENHIYLYFDAKIRIEFGRKNQPQFIQAMQSAINGLLIVDKGLNDYVPSISKLDPRNPYGLRYDPTHPRGYVVAYTKNLRNGPNGIDDAIEAAKREAMLPADWSISMNGISRDAPPPGVPCVFHVGF